MNILQGNVATYLKCDGIFDDRYIANFLVKDFFKSVNICIFGCLFMTHGVQ